MRSDERRLLLALVLLALTPLLAASRATSDNVIVRDTDVVDEDFFVLATNLRVSGIIEGDLVATSFQRAEIDGSIHGDVQIIASEVEISGSIEGGARIVADRIIVSGRIGDDVLLIGRTVRVSGEVARDALVWAVDAAFSGSAGREALIVVLDDAVVAATVSGGTEVIADTITFEPGATFGSGVRARADDVRGVEHVTGRVTRPGDLPTPLRTRALLWSGGLAAVAFMVALWLALFWLAPATVQAGVRAAESEPVRVFASGLWVLTVATLLLIGPPVVGLIMFPAAALGVYVFGGPLFIVYAAFVAMFLFVGAVPTGTVLGRRIIPSASPLSAFVVGAASIGVVLLIPWIRWLVVLPLVAGGGALWQGASQNRGSIEWLKVGAEDSTSRPTDHAS